MDNHSFSTIILEYGVQLQDTVKLSSLMQQNIRVDTDLDVHGDQIRRLQMFLLRHSNPQRVALKSPATWFDHMRLALAPAWVNRKWPPRFYYEEVEISDLEIPREAMDRRFDPVKIAIKKPSPLYWEQDWSDLGY